MHRGCSWRCGRLWLRLLLQRCLLVRRCKAHAGKLLQLSELSAEFLCVASSTLHAPFQRCHVSRHGELKEVARVELIGSGDALRHDGDGEGKGGDDDCDDCEGTGDDAPLATLQPSLLLLLLCSLFLLFSLSLPLPLSLPTTM